MYFLDTSIWVQKNINVRGFNTLKVSKLMREMGEGMKRIFTLMQENGLKKPKLYSNTVWFTMTLFNKNN
jgi:predicted HTH transcriptional regulator